MPKPEQSRFPTPGRVLFECIAHEPFLLYRQRTDLTDSGNVSIANAIVSLVEQNPLHGGIIEKIAMMLLA